MSNWKRTFKMDVVNVDGHNACAQVWSAITDASNALASIYISVDTDHGHANRLKELEAEAAALTQEAA